MLKNKNKSLLEQFDLVEQLDNRAAQTFNGGVTVHNETGSRQTLYWIHSLSGKCGRLTLPDGESGTVYRNEVTLIYDRNPYRGQWDPIIAEGSYDKEDVLTLIPSDTNPDIVDLVQYYKLLTEVEVVN